MSREFTGPLTADDLEWLGSRVPQAHLNRLIEVNGLEDVETVPGGPEAPEGAEGEGSALGSGDGPETGEEDLIGDAGQPAFNPQDHTEAEITAHLKENPDDRERVLALEAEGRGRKGVLAL